MKTMTIDYYRERFLLSPITTIAESTIHNQSKINFDQRYSSPANDTTVPKWI